MSRASIESSTPSSRDSTWNGKPAPSTYLHKQLDVTVGALSIDSGPRRGYPYLNGSCLHFGGEHLGRFHLHAKQAFIGKRQVQRTLNDVSTCASNGVQRQNAGTTRAGGQSGN